MSPSYVEDRVAGNEEEQQCPRHVAHRYTWLLRVLWEAAATKWVVTLCIAAAAQLVRATIDAIAIIVGGGG